MQYKHLFIYIIFCLVLVDALFLSKRSDLITFPILAGYIAGIVFYKLTSKVTFSYSFILLFISYILFLRMGAAGAAEKAAVWLYLFLVIGVIQKWRE